MSPRAVVKIWRQHAKVGGRLIVSTLAIDPNGRAVHRFAWAEGRPQVATGELVWSGDAAGEASKEDGAALPVLLPADKAKPAEGAGAPPAGDVE